jgi:hypothetical protein
LAAVEFAMNRLALAFALSAAIGGLSGTSMAAQAQAPAAANAFSNDPARAPAGAYELDKRHASVTAKVSHFGFSNYTFLFRDLDATLQYDPRNLAASKITFTVDPKSIDTGLPDFDKELAGDDWLGSTPARFVSTGPPGDGSPHRPAHGQPDAQGRDAAGELRRHLQRRRAQHARQAHAGLHRRGRDRPHPVWHRALRRSDRAGGAPGGGSGVQQGPMTATHESRREGGRYSLVSITLHWTIAALIVTQIPLGWRMSDLPFGSAKFELFQLHKSIGITILALSLVRLGWRLTHPAPPLPDHMAAGRRSSRAPPTSASTWS